MADKEGGFRPGGDEKTLFKERILEASKFIVGIQELPVIDYHGSICHWATEVPELRGVLQLPELHARYATAHTHTHNNNY